MDLRRYGRIFRRQWRLIALSVAVCTVAAAAIATTKPSTYAARSEMFVSATKAATLGDAYEGGLFIQQRVASYTQILSSAALVKRVIDQLRLPDTVQHLQGEITAAVPAGTVLIDVMVKDRSATRAQAIGEALDGQFASYVSRLETPQADGQPSVTVSVVSPAGLQTRPLSPQTRLDVGLGVLIGLVLGVIGAVTLEALDDRIREEEDVALITEAPVLGRLVRDSGVRRHGRELLAAPDSPTGEAFRRLRASLHTTIDNEPRTFAIASAVPGEGKTFVAANLGVAVARTGQRVVLVNADVHSRSLAQMLGATPTRGLTDVLAGDGSLDVALHTDFNVPLELLDSGPPPADPGAIFESGRFAELLNTLGGRGDAVIVDAAAVLEEPDAAVVAAAVSWVILVVGVGTTRKSDLTSTVQALRMAGARLLGVVLNGVSHKEVRRYVRVGIGTGRAAAAPSPTSADGVPLRPAAEQSESQRPDGGPPASRFSPG
jgi:succinoglycan biosynthesis transport protein ExoP